MCLSVGESLCVKEASLCGCVSLCGRGLCVGVFLCLSVCLFVEVVCHDFGVIISFSQMKKMKLGDSK